MLEDLLDDDKKYRTNENLIPNFLRAAIKLQLFPSLFNCQINLFEKLKNQYYFFTRINDIYKWNELKRMPSNT